jgi:hypothetical protein
MRSGSPTTGSPWWDQQGGRRRGWGALLLVTLLWTGIVLGREGWPAPVPDPAALEHLLCDHFWVVYDPTEMTLDDRRRPIYPPDAYSIEQDLDLIRASGITGICIYTSNNIMVEVPRLAQERGLKVILGIWDVHDRSEISRAIWQSSYVDAYCVGGEGLGDRYSLDELRRALFLVRRQTGRPAAISERARHYDEMLAGLGDWIFPEVHLTVKDDDDLLVARVDLDRDIEIAMSSIVRFVSLSSRHRKTLVLKNLGYPYAGVEGASRTIQAEFFRRLLERLSGLERAHGVRLSAVFQGAFDNLWKNGTPFLAWDPYTGLIDRRMVDASRLALDPGTDVDAGTRRRLLSAVGREILRWCSRLRP